ncbi:hypothetical protein V8G54_037583 [Vigna mungo]|uniref:Uncharacterized protein n=1 Tax=Vigna mungo TaxID=3915 RepID=A0AAQ3MKJ9_VIGMU
MQNLEPQVRPGPKNQIIAESGPDPREITLKQSCEAWHQFWMPRLRASVARASGPTPGRPVVISDSLRVSSLLGAFLAPFELHLLGFSLLLPVLLQSLSKQEEFYQNHMANNGVSTRYHEVTFNVFKDEKTIQVKKASPKDAEEDTSVTNLSKQAVKSVKKKKKIVKGRLFIKIHYRDRSSRFKKCQDGGQEVVGDKLGKLEQKGRIDHRTTLNALLRGRSARTLQTSARFCIGCSFVVSGWSECVRMTLRAPFLALSAGERSFAYFLDMASSSGSKRIKTMATNMEKEEKGKNKHFQTVQNRRLLMERKVGLIPTMAPQFERELGRRKSKTDFYTGSTNNAYIQCPSNLGSKCTIMEFIEAPRKNINLLSNPKPNIAAHKTIIAARIPSPAICTHVEQSSTCHQHSSQDAKPMTTRFTGCQAYHSTVPRLPSLQSNAAVFTGCQAFKIKTEAPSLMRSWLLNLNLSQERSPPSSWRILRASKTEK